MLSKLLIISTYLLYLTRGDDDIELVNSSDDNGPGIKFDQNGNTYCLTFGRTYETTNVDGECMGQKIAGTEVNYMKEQFHLGTDSYKITSEGALNFGFNYLDSSSDNDDHKVAIEVSGEYEFTSGDSNLVLEVNFAECDSTSTSSRDSTSDSTSQTSVDGSNDGTSVSDDGTSVSHDGTSTTSVTSTDGTSITSADGTSTTSTTSLDGTSTTSTDETSNESNTSEESTSGSDGQSTDGSTTSDDTGHSSDDSAEDRQELDQKITDMLGSFQATKTCSNSGERRRLKFSIRRSLAKISSLESELCSFDNEGGNLVYNVVFENFGDCQLTATSNAMNLDAQSHKNDKNASTTFNITFSLVFIVSVFLFFV